MQSSATQKVKVFTMAKKKEIPQIEWMKISDVKTNLNNPRVIKDDKFKKLVKSIEEFPQMLQIRPIVIDKDNFVLGGNMRLKACMSAGLKEIPILRADNLTTEQQSEFIIKDNASFGEWDWDVLANEWDVDDLGEWGVLVPNYSSEEQKNTKDISFQIETDYKLEIELSNEKDQSELFEELTKRGYKCRVLTL